MAAEWYYAKGDERVGPVSASDLKALAKSGELSPNDMVWKEGMAEWKSAEASRGWLNRQSTLPRSDNCRRRCQRTGKQIHARSHRA